jgi:4-diphosphocytidyl-2-C-methyl-D-erythritol kinase
VILFPNCKINLGLYITGKRPDGYHNLQTCFYPVALHDVLEIVETPDAQTTLFASGMESGSGADNSCMKAYRLLKKAFPHLPEVAIHLHKAIPVGGGLGGGSADAAFTLVLLNRKFQLNLTEDALLANALELGSDCPFFIKNTPCIATGRGEELQPFPLDLSGYKIVLVNPGIHINTGWAFTQITPEPPAITLSALLQQPVAQWKHCLVNVFEPALFRQHPAIKEVKDVLYQAGAVYASLSGSGATVYGIFEKEHPIRFSFPTHYLVKEC